MMDVYRLQIENVKYNINQIRLYFEENYPNTIHMYLIKGWFKSYNKDAEIISDIFNYRKFDDIFSTNICCGFPKEILHKIKYQLKELNINFTIIDTSDYTYEYYDYKSKNNYESYYNDIGSLKENSVKKNNKQRIENNKIQNNIEKPENTKTKNYNSDLFVEIGDTVSIRNNKTDKIETYTINKEYSIPKPACYSGEYGKNFGKVIYKKELLTTSDLENGIITSESELAKKLLGTYLNSTLILVDDNLENCVYEIIDIKKH